LKLKTTMGGNSSKRAPVYDIEGAAAKSAPCAPVETYDETTPMDAPDDDIVETKQQLINMKEEMLNNSLKTKCNTLLQQVKQNINTASYIKDTLISYIDMYKTHSDKVEYLGFDIKLMNQLIILSNGTFVSCETCPIGHSSVQLSEGARYYTCWLNAAIVAGLCEAVAFFLPTICNLNIDGKPYIMRSQHQFIKIALAKNSTLDIVILLLTLYRGTDIDLATEAAPYLDKVLETNDKDQLNKVRVLMNLIKSKPF